MNEIEYKYRTIEEIIKSIDTYINFSILQGIILLLITAAYIIAILYFIPIFREKQSIRTQVLEKKGKKLALKQIVIQKEIESEIEKELQKEEKEGK